MLDVITDWAKNICLALILISILEMLLPNNKTKKYVKMVMGIYLLFSIPPYHNLAPGKRGDSGGYAITPESLGVGGAGSIRLDLNIHIPPYISI